MLAAVCVALAQTAFAQTFDLGRTALPEEIEAWDIDVRPDGQGLPPGSGSVSAGEELFIERCAMCHGDFGEGLGRWPVLAGGQGSLASEDPVKTVGSYWPFLSTAWDYIHRAMPFGDAQSLTDDEVYASLAYILYMNDLVEEDFVLSQSNFTDLRMPNEENFFADDRPDTATLADGEPCMANCKATVEITKRARVIDVTPEEEANAGAQNTEPAMTPESAQAAATAPTYDAVLADTGAKLFKTRCMTCHRVEAEVHKTGPSLHDVVGAEAASAEGFQRYSRALTESGLVWDAATLDAFLAKPKAVVKGTRMSFAGLKNGEDRTAIIEYLKSLSEVN